MSTEGLDTGIPHAESIDPIEQLDAENERIMGQEQPEGPLTAEQLMAKYEAPTDRVTDGPLMDLRDEIVAAAERLAKKDTQ